MKYLQTYQIFERKGNYQLFHKTSSLDEILKDGYIKCGGGDNDDCKFWNTALRKSVLPHWKQNDTKFKTISATRNLYYLGLPALELDVEKISDKYRIIPFSENPDFYLDFEGKPAKTKLGRFQNQLRSKDKNVGKLLWRVKTDKSAMDFGIAEELILTDKLDVSKYVKRIILKKNDKYGYYNNKKIKEIVKNKYPHIEVVEINSENYTEVKKELSKIKDKETVLTEGFADLLPFTSSVFKLFTSKYVKKITSNITKILKANKDIKFEWEFIGDSGVFLIIKKPGQSLSLEDIYIDIAFEKQWIEFLIKKNVKLDELIYVEDLLKEIGEVMPSKPGSGGFNKYHITLPNVEKLINRLNLDEFNLHKDTEKYNL